MSDTSAISNLAIAGHLDLLRQLYENIVIPPAVFRELLNNHNPDILAIQTLEWIQTRPVRDLVFLESLKANLDLGEAEAIAWQ